MITQLSQLTREIFTHLRETRDTLRHLRHVRNAVSDSILAELPGVSRAMIPTLEKDSRVVVITYAKPVLNWTLMNRVRKQNLGQST